MLFWTDLTFSATNELQFLEDQFWLAAGIPDRVLKFKLLYGKDNDDNIISSRASPLLILLSINIIFPGQSAITLNKKQYQTFAMIREQKLKK